MGSQKSPPKDSAKARKASARERIAAAREAERRRERVRWIITIAVTGAVVAVLAVIGVQSFMANNRPAKLPHPAAATGTGLPPWPLPADATSAAKSAGLTVAAMEGTASHFHAHLDVLVNGKAIPVPANLGIDSSGQAMSELHTHDATGVVHIESPSANKRYTLGQVFDEWGVRLDTADLGGLKTDATHTLTVYVNGKQQSGDPAAVELTKHREIAVVYGPAGANTKIPSSYTFAQGE
jgi:hypothetical protein